MQDHEKQAIQLFLIGVTIAIAKLLAVDEKISWRVVIGRSLLNGFTSLGAGTVLIWIADLPPLGILGLGAFLGTLGSQFVETQAQKWIKRKSGGCQ